MGTPTAILFAKPPYDSWVLALSFHSEKEPVELIAKLKECGYEETLVCPPYFGNESRHYNKPEPEAYSGAVRDFSNHNLDEIKSILSFHGIDECHEVKLTWHDIH